MAREAISAFELMRDSGQLEGCSLYLLTLTQKNVDRGQLAITIDEMLDALKRLRHIRDVRRSLVGSARNIEVTYNYRMHTWHPHVHLILILKDGNKAMTKKKYWQALWASLMGLSYKPETDFQKIRDEGAIFEVSKYVAKSTEMLMSINEDEKVDVIDELNKALADRNLTIYTGIWRKARRALKMVDHDDGSDVLWPDKCGCGGEFINALMVWNGNEYVVAEPDERLKDVPDDKKLAAHMLFEILDGKKG